jgi:Glycine rich protein
MRLNVLSTVVASAIVLAMPRSAMAFTFDYTGSIQEYTVQDAGVYSIFAVGAQGGAFDSGPTDPADPGEKGSLVTGAFQLQGGDILNILVGGKGGNGNGLVAAGGGGGGTFVALKVLNPATGSFNFLPLVVAGGGNGYGISRFNPAAGGGGGYSRPGRNGSTDMATTNFAPNYVPPTGGSSFLDGGRGGNGGRGSGLGNDGNGGYGGGGGGGFQAIDNATFTSYGGVAGGYFSDARGDYYPGIVSTSPNSGLSFIGRDRLANNENYGDGFQFFGDGLFYPSYNSGDGGASINLISKSVPPVDSNSVPTPALLPGIMALGLKVLRKRKEAVAAAV